MGSELQRTLNLKDSISVVVGSMIGCGIFIVSADIARYTQSAFLLLMVLPSSVLLSVSMLSY